MTSRSGTWQVESDTASSLVTGHTTPMGGASESRHIPADIGIPSGTAVITGTDRHSSGNRGPQHPAVAGGLQDTASSFCSSNLRGGSAGQESHVADFQTDTK